MDRHLFVHLKSWTQYTILAFDSQSGQTSPALSKAYCVKLGLSNIREKSFAKYIINLLARKCSLTFQCLESLRTYPVLNYHQRQFSFREKYTIEKYNIPICNIHKKLGQRTVAPWDYTTPIVNTSLKYYTQHNTQVIIQKFYYIINTYDDPTVLYTAGSKNSSSVGFSVINNDITVCESILPIFSSYS